MIFKEIQTLKIKHRFKFYPHLVVGEDRRLYQLTHFKKRRTCYFKEIVLNKERKGFRINSQWVALSTLQRLKIEVSEEVVL